MPLRCVVLQLRVIRAFKSTLEDLEEQRSVHSLHSLRSSRSHSGLRPTSDITYIDEDGGPSVKSSSPQGLLPGAAISSGEQQFVVSDHRNRPIAAGGVDSYASGAGADRADWERDRYRDGHVGHHQQQYAPRSANNNRAQLKSGVNGHTVHTSVASGRTESFGSNGGGQSVGGRCMSPSQMLIAAPYQPLSPQHLSQMNLPAPPSGLLPVALDYVSIPDLPDLPRLVHETSI